MDFESIKAYFNVKSGGKDSCMAICPCHSDNKASLSIKYDRAGRKTLIYCHAGCDAKDILSRVGLEMKDLFDEEKIRERKEDRIEAVYKYTDCDGHLLFEKVRFRPKAFTQRRYVDGAAVWGLGGGMYYETYPGSNEYSMKERNGARAREFPEVRPVLYNLPGLIKAVNEKETVFIAEGEKDADNLIKHNLTATTNFDGASKSVDRQKWRKEYNEYLKGVDVVLLPDNDSPGKFHMMNIAKELKGIAKSVRMVELPVPQKEDVSYYLEEGHTIDDLLNLVRNTVHTGNCMNSDLSLISYNFSDLGNAERLIALYGSDIRYSFPQNKFFIWSGKHWQADTTGGIYHLAKKTLRRLCAEGEALGEDEDAGETKKKIISFAIRSENDGKIKAMVNQAKNQPEITFSESDMNPLNRKV
jgi:putative DNA primase/helicase